jgi:hypothetical protein
MDKLSGERAFVVKCKEAFNRHKIPLSTNARRYQHSINANDRINPSIL